MTRACLSRHPHDCRCRSIDLETTTTAATACDSTKWIDTHMTDLSSSAINSPPQFAVQNNAAADSRSKCDANNSAVSPTGTHPHLAHCRGVRIIFQHGTVTKLRS